MQKLARYLLCTTALIPLALPALANPLDPNVVAGNAVVSGQGSASLTVNQSTDKAIIDWRTFNIGTSERTEFVQPGSQSVTLNRVTGGEGASQILGTLMANGQVFLVNPDGILFGADATIDVGGLVATTHDLLNEDFMAGTYRFDRSGDPNASIVNLGTITVEDGGFAALVAPGVRNAGVIRANVGYIGLASADGFTLDFYGDQLIQLAVDDSTAGNVIDLATGETLQDLVSNSGLLSAKGGTVQLTASAARAVVNSVINNTGNIEADTVGTRNGKIVLGAATASSKPAGAPIQSVKVSGTLSAAGDEQGETGGTVGLTGELIELTNATIDAFGWSGGGKVLVGGDYMGGNGDSATIQQFGIELETDTVPTASYLFADEGTKITADGLQTGDGGKIILWSDIATVTAAELVARGGAHAGNGGFIETSGKYLAALVAADASAPNGVAGTWLLDPLDVHIKVGANSNFASTTKTIYPGITGDSTFPTANPSVISVANVEAALNSGTNVRVTTRGTTGSQPGDIYVEDDITKSAGGDVFAIIDSARNVYFTSGIRLVSTSGKVSFLVYAKSGKVVATNLHVDVNGGQFLIESSEVSPNLVNDAAPVPQVASVWTTANSTPSQLIAKSNVDGLDRWLDTSSPLTPQQVVQRARLYLAMSDIAYEENQLSSWGEYADEMGLTAEDVAFFKSVGFNAVTKQAGNELIIAFEGSDEWVDWKRTNFPNQIDIWKEKLGFGSELTGDQEQYLIAAYFVEVVAKSNPSKEIILTGHSLGGGLASYAAAMNDVRAIVFDPAAVRLNRAERVAANPENVLNLIVTGGGADLGSVLGTTITFTSTELSKPLQRGLAASIDHLHSLDRFWEIIDGAPVGII